MFLEKIKIYQEINSPALREVLKLLYLNRESLPAFYSAVTETLGFSRYELAKSLKILKEANYLNFEAESIFLDFSGKGLNLNSLNSYREYFEEQQKYEHFCNIMLKGSFDRISEVLKIRNDGTC